MSCLCCCGQAPMCSTVDGGGSTPLHEAAQPQPRPCGGPAPVGCRRRCARRGLRDMQASTVGGVRRPHCTSPRANNPESAVVAALLAAGADPNASAPTGGWTPLHLAASGKTETGRLFGSWSPRAQTSARGRGPVRRRFTVAARNNPEVVPLLLELGADPYAVR